MLKYVAKRLVQAAPTVLGVVVLIFFFVRALPGDPARLYAGVDSDISVVEAVRERVPGLSREALQALTDAPLLFTEG